MLIKRQKEVLAAIHDSSKGYTIVLITHFMEEAVDADKIIVMNDGKIILTGTPKEVFTQSDLLMNATSQFLK